jgi:ankyrin repeat protein
MAVADAIDAQSVAALIKAGADVNAKDADIDALFLAAEKGHIKVVKILIDNGADVYRETKMGSAQWRSPALWVSICRTMYHGCP